MLKGYSTEIRRIYCDGDTVIIEMTNRATTPAASPTPTIIASSS